MDVAGQGEAEGVVPTGLQRPYEGRQGIGAISFNEGRLAARIAQQPADVLKAVGVVFPRRRGEKDTASGPCLAVPDLGADRLMQDGLKPSHPLRHVEEVTEILLPHHAEIARHRSQYLRGKNGPRGTAKRLPPDLCLETRRIVEQKARQRAGILSDGFHGVAEEASELRQDLPINDSR